MQYANMRNAYNNQEKYRFPGVGQYEIPEIRPVDMDVSGCEFVRFDRAMRERCPQNKIVHFFMDDYIFDRIWRDPERYMRVLKRFRAIVAPDFSLYTDHPKAIQIYNHFRKHWLSAYWQSVGLTVIPSIRWIEYDISGFSWCLDGEPKGSTICVSTQGGIKGQARKDDFIRGLQVTIDMLHPSRLIIFGDTFPELLDLRYAGDIDYVDSDLMRRREVMGTSTSGSRGGVRDNGNWEDHGPEGYTVLNEGNVDAKMENAKWEKMLSDDEKAALHRYTSAEEAPEIINRQLRAGAGSRYKATAENLESALKKGYVKQNTILHRISTPDLLGGASTVSAIRAMYGSTVHDAGFTSASAVPNSDKYKSLKGRMAYHIKVPQGRGIGAFVKNHSDYAWEQEFLFNRGSSFRVEGAWEDRDGVVHVNLRYVGRGK